MNKTSVVPDVGATIGAGIPPEADNYTQCPKELGRREVPRLPGSAHKANKPSPRGPDSSAPHRKPSKSTPSPPSQLALPLPTPLLPPVTRAFHATSDGATYLHSSAPDAFPQSLECSSIPSFTVLIVLKSAKFHLCSKIDPHPRSE